MPPGELPWGGEDPNSVKPSSLCLPGPCSSLWMPESPGPAGLLVMHCGLPELPFPPTWPSLPLGLCLVFAVLQELTAPGHKASLGLRAGHYTLTETRRRETLRH